MAHGVVAQFVQSRLALLSARANEHHGRNLSLGHGDFCRLESKVCLIGKDLSSFLIATVSIRNSSNLEPLKSRPAKKKPGKGATRQAGCSGQSLGEPFLALPRLGFGKLRGAEKPNPMALADGPRTIEFESRVREFPSVNMGPRCQRETTNEIVPCGGLLASPRQFRREHPEFKEPRN